MKHGGRHRYSEAKYRKADHDEKCAAFHGLHVW
jgi:hypothetical protein